MTDRRELDTISPVSHRLNVSVLPARGRRETIEADAEQRQALAAEHDLVSVERFAADIEVKRWQRDGVRLVGTIDAEITQRCVVTLDPLPARVRAPFEAVFVPDDSPLSRRTGPGEGADIIVDAEGPDLPEPFTPPMLDIGAAAEEFFALALDPYPRKKGAEPPEDFAPDPADAPENPFASLAALKTNGER